jgi:hypothetical protein
MSAHKFRIGQHVYYTSRGADASPRVYVIIARLPQGDDGEFKYRIRHSHEIYERVAKESELRATASHGN